MDPLMAFFILVGLVGFGLLDHDLGLNVAFERLVYGDRSGRKDVGMRGIPAALLADHVAPYDGARSLGKLLQA